MQNNISNADYLDFLNVARERQLRLEAAKLYRKQNQSVKRLTNVDASVSVYAVVLPRKDSDGIYDTALIQYESGEKRVYNTGAVKLFEIRGNGATFKRVNAQGVTIATTHDEKFATACKSVLRHIRMIEKYGMVADDRADNLDKNISGVDTSEPIFVTLD